MLKILKKQRSKSSNNSQKNNTKQFHNKDGLKNVTRVALLLALVTMVAVSIFQIILPVKPCDPGDVIVVNDIENRHPRPTETKPEIKMKHPVRGGLFKPSRGIALTGRDDKVVDEIFKNLKVKSIMQIGGKKVAYIVLKNGQMKSCKVGDTVKDMFTVIDIQKKTVTIDILGHKRNLTI